MGPGLKDLEIVYNLQWKNVSGHGDDKANIVGMYDIPATTLNWETFKFYLLKNSGTTGDDVKVSYVSIDDKEFPIESQLDFQIALYSFRQRARNGDIITLKLDRISDQGKMGRIKRLRRSVEPQLAEKKIEVAAESKPSAPVVVAQNDAPPEWFKKYMKGFKKEIVEDVTKSVIDYVSNLKPVTASSSHPSHNPRKLKIERIKHPRKAPLLLNRPEINDRELIKSLKLEQKLDNKLERLQQKTMKIKEKKLCLIRNTDDEINQRSSRKSRPIGMPLSDTEILMDASAVGQHESTIPHMSGGETYQQEWEVVNTGDVEWTENTELRYAWGSEALKPVEKIVPCPNLKPGEKGTVVVYLEIPKTPGNYECYWHFYHDSRRFGHWLGCQVIVDPPATKQSAALRLFFNNKDLILQSLPGTAKNNLKSRRVSSTDVLDKPLNTNNPFKYANSEGEDLNFGLRDLKIYDTEVAPDSNSSSSDSDNQSIVSIADSNSSIHSGPSDEFVVVPMPEPVNVNEEEITIEKVINNEILVEKIKIEKDDDVKPINESESQDVMIIDEVPQQSGDTVIEIIKEEPIDVEAGNEFETKDSSYAYIMINDRKVAVPKTFLRPDYLATAEDAPVPSMIESEVASMIASTSQTEQINDDIISIVTNSESTQQNGNNPGPLDLTLEKEEIKKPEKTYVATEFNTENSNKSRLFVFPLNCPGFEVVYPPNSCVESLPEFESIESNLTPKLPNGTGPEVAYEVVYLNPLAPNCSHHEIENPYGYNWAKSESAYSYTPISPPSVGFKYEDNPSPAQSTNGAQAYREAGSPHTLHHRFGSYMRRPAFNHAKHCSGMHCRQPLFKNASADSTRTENYSQYSEPGQNYPPRYRVYMPRSQNPTGITMPQPIPRAPPSNDGQTPPPAPKSERSSSVHILPDTLVTGAVNVASSAINTARSVLNMFSPPQPKSDQGQWESGIWTTNDPESPRERALRILAEMGFWDRNLNATLLARYNDDLARVISELVQ